MTATEELRRLLDERGVEWQDFDGEPTWMGSDGEMHYARQEFTFDGLTDNVTVYHLTPEQAVEATLGSDLQAENAELREQLQDAEHEESIAWDRVRSAERRNDKLRELVRELYDELDAATQYDAGGGRGVVYEFANRMHELGVEV